MAEQTIEQATIVAQAIEINNLNAQLAKVKLEKGYLSNALEEMTAMRDELLERCQNDNRTKSP